MSASRPRIARKTESARCLSAARGVPRACAPLRRPASGSCAGPASFRGVRPLASAATSCVVPIFLIVLAAALSLVACAHDFGTAPEPEEVGVELRVDDAGTLWLMLRIPGWPESDTSPDFLVELDGKEVVTRPVAVFVDRTLRYRIASGALASSATRVRLLPADDADALLPLLGGGRARLSLPQALDVAEASPLPAAPAAPDARALQAELVQGCGCHFEPDRETRSLALAELRWTPSFRDPERMLVVPGRPERSLLVHVLLDGYPDRAGVAMPPPWAEEVDGRAVEALAVGLARWIEAGAPMDGEASAAPSFAPSSAASPAPSSAPSSAASPAPSSAPSSAPSER